MFICLSVSFLSKLLCKCNEGVHYYKYVILQQFNDFLPQSHIVKCIVHNGEARSYLVWIVEVL